MPIQTASLFVMVGAVPDERYLLVRRAPTKGDGGPQSYRYVLQPAVNGKIKHTDADPVACLLREAEHEGGKDFAMFLRRYMPFFPLQPIDGYEHVHCYHAVLQQHEADLFVAGPEFCETLELTAEEVGGIEAIDMKAHKENGVPRDSRMMFPDHRLILRALVTSMRGW